MPRAVSTALGVLLLTAVTLVLAGAVGAIAVDLPTRTTQTVPHQLSATANGSSDEVFITHESGPTLDVREIQLKIFIDGTPLEHQPPVPFLGSTGFRGAPHGPFNPSSNPDWDVGERAGVEIAGTNDPTLGPDALVRVEVYRDGLLIAVTETRAR